MNDALNAEIGTTLKVVVYDSGNTVAADPVVPLGQSSFVVSGLGPGDYTVAVVAYNSNAAGANGVSSARSAAVTVSPIGEPLLHTHAREPPAGLPRCCGLLCRAAPRWARPPAAAARQPAGLLRVPPMQLGRRPSWPPRAAPPRWCCR